MLPTNYEKSGVEWDISIIQLAYSCSLNTNLALCNIASRGAMNGRK